MKKEQITKAAKLLASKIGVNNLTQHGLCQAAGVPSGTFSHHMGCTFSEFIKKMAKDDDSSHTLTRRRASPDARKRSILAAGIAIANEIGVNNVKAGGVAVKASVSTSLVNCYMGTAAELKTAIMKEAINTNELKIIGFGVVHGDPLARAVSPQLQKQAIATLTH